jgi:hypothetical protein
LRLGGFFDTARFDEPYIMATLKVVKLGIEEDVKFLVDTGSPDILIFDADVENLGIDIEDLPEEKKYSARGAGGPFSRYILKNVSLIFLTDKGEQHKEKIKKVYVVKQDDDYVYKKKDEKYRMPSILGRVVLNKYLMIYRRSDETLVITNEKIAFKRKYKMTNKGK